MTIPELNDTVNPEGDEDETDTEPVKPLVPVMMTVDDPDEPPGTPIGFGLAETLKSVTTKVRVAGWDSVPLVAVTVRL